MTDPRIRQIKIKTGVVKRLVKDVSSYRTEGEQQERRVERLKEEGADEHTIKKQLEVLQESIMMVPDCRRRLGTAHAELNQLLLEAEEDLNQSEEYQEARKVLDSVQLEG